MRKIYFGDFRVIVIEHLKIISSYEPEAYSTEWFLIKYLKKIIKMTEPPSEHWRVDSSMRSLIRFYVDNIDEKSEHGERCRFIYDQYKKTLKQRQDSKYT